MKRSSGSRLVIVYLNSEAFAGATITLFFQVTVKRYQFYFSRQCKSCAVGVFLRRPVALFCEILREAHNVLDMRAAYSFSSYSYPSGSMLPASRRLSSSSKNLAWLGAWMRFSVCFYSARGISWGFQSSISKIFRIQ
jgi:hypothetical protein